jgi:hypothetical protein
MQQRRRFLNPAQPQTLQIAVFLLYINAAFTLFAAFRLGGRVNLGIMHADARLVFLVIAAAGIFAGFGIANERKWGYGLGIVMAFLPFTLNFLAYGNPFSSDLLSTMFEIALVALLLHPQSRDYQRIWFK